LVRKSISSEKFFVTSKKFRHFCPTFFCPIRYAEIRTKAGLLFTNWAYVTSSVYRIVNTTGVRIPLVLYFCTNKKEWYISQIHTSAYTSVDTLFISKGHIWNELKQKQTQFENSTLIYHYFLLLLLLLLWNCI